MLIELHQKSPNMAISQGPIFYVEIRLLKGISSLIVCNIKLMAEISKKVGKRRKVGGKVYMLNLEIH